MGKTLTVYYEEGNYIPGIIAWYGEIANETTYDEIGLCIESQHPNLYLKGEVV